MLNVCRYAASKFFSLQYPNGTVSDGDGEYYPCSDSPGTTLAEVFTIQKKADMAGLYVRRVLLTDLNNHILIGGRHSLST